MNLKDKVIIVTGASQGLGKAITKNLISKGAKVAMISRNQDDSFVNENKEFVYSYNCDITDKKQVKKVVEEIAEEAGSIDGLVNNAGVWVKMTPLEEVGLDDIDTVLDTNLKGLIYMTKETLPYLKKRKEATLVNISSKSGSRPMEHQAVYSASKYGVRGFTDTLKLELKDTSVKVMGFYPSGMNTKMFEKVKEDVPAETFMNVDEIAEIITFAIERKGNISIEEIQVEKY